MRRTVAKIKPASGFSKLIHWVLVAILPILALVFVKWSILPLAYGIVVLSKWRMFAVRPRHWPANVRANSVDIMVSLSFVVFMAQSPTTAWQLVWLIGFEAWLVIIKPKSKIFWTSTQAALGQSMGLTAVYLLWGRASLIYLTVLTWLICYLSARHFFSSFDEPLSSMMSHIWGYVSAALIWVLGHWLLYYGFMSQPVLILSILSYGLGALYYLENFDKLSTLIKREIILIMSAVIVVVILFSSWGDKTL